MVPYRLEAFATKLPPPRVRGMFPYDPATDPRRPNLRPAIAGMDFGAGLVWWTG